MKRKILVFLVFLIAAQAFASFASAENGRFIPGTYTGTAHGNNDWIVVDVTVDKESIKAIDIKESHETFYMSEKPYKEIPDAILEKQTLAVDIVSGATNTSRALINAVTDALKQAGADIEALKKTEEIVKRDATAECEVVVVGAGIAGLNAASKLQEMGVDVMLVEQLDITGGCAKFSGGAFLAATTEDKYETLVNHWLKSTTINRSGSIDQYPNMDKLTMMLRETTETARWVREEIGVDVVLDDAGISVSAASPAGYEHVKVYRGSFLTDGYEKYYLNKGGKLLLGTEVTDLIQDEKGKVTGVVCEQKTDKLTIYADAVILCTGSYSYNEEYKAKYLPQTVGQITACSVGDTGTGIEMALKAGAVMYDDPFVAGASVHANPVNGLRTNNGDAFFGDNTTASMFVSFDGKRNCSETARIVNFYENMDKTNGFYGLYDAALIEELGRTQSYDEAITRGEAAYYKADTIEELAAKMGVDAQVLKSEVDRYNGYCANGIDEQYGKAKELLNAIDEAPFYAVKYTFVNNDLVHGIQTSVKGEVLKEDGSTIDGLYAAGYISIRDFYDDGNMGGACLCVCTTMGRVVAQNVAEYVK